MRIHSLTKNFTLTTMTIAAALLTAAPGIAVAGESMSGSGITSATGTTTSSGGSSSSSSGTSSSSSGTSTSSSSTTTTTSGGGSSSSTSTSSPVTDQYVPEKPVTPQPKPCPVGTTTNPDGSCAAPVTVPAPIVNGGGTAPDTTPEPVEDVLGEEAKPVVEGGGAAPKAGELPFTGLPIAWVAALGMALMFAGFAAWIRGRIARANS